MMTSTRPALPSNVHVSTHPCLQAKLSLLRSSATQGRDVKVLLHDISLILGCDALAARLRSVSANQSKAGRGKGAGDWDGEVEREGPSEQGQRGRTTLGFDYMETTIEPANIRLVPILRAGLGMVEAIETLLPHPVAVHHLGLYRDPTSLHPVEYYNNLPHFRSGNNTTTTTSPTSACFPTSTPTISTAVLYPQPNTSASTQQTQPGNEAAIGTTNVAPVGGPVLGSTHHNGGAQGPASPQQPHDGGSSNKPPSLAVILDPVIATGGTCTAAIQALREWGAQRVLVLAVVASQEGVQRAAAEWPEACDIWVGSVDEELTESGMVKPGLGDIGDRMFRSVGR